MSSKSQATGLYVTDETNIDELYQYVEERVLNPTTVENNVVWNFSTHPIDHSGLTVTEKKENEFLIPYQVTGVWGPMFQMLPERVRSAEVLIWHADQDEYYAYRQFYRDLDESERLAGFRDNLSIKVDDSLSETKIERGR